MLFISKREIFVSKLEIVISNLETTVSRHEIRLFVVQDGEFSPVFARTRCSARYFHAAREKGFRGKAVPLPYR